MPRECDVIRNSIAFLLGVALFLAAASQVVPTASAANPPSVSFDNARAYSTTCSGLLDPNITVAYTVHDANNSAALAVFVFYFSSSLENLTTSIAYADENLTFLAWDQDQASGTGVSVWLLTGPTAGNNSLNVSTAGNPQSLNIVVISMTGVNQTAPVVQISSVFSSRFNAFITLPIWMRQNNNAVGGAYGLFENFGDNPIYVAGDQNERAKNITDSCSGLFSSAYDFNAPTSGSEMRFASYRSYTESFILIEMAVQLRSTNPPAGGAGGTASTVCDTACSIQQTISLLLLLMLLVVVLAIIIGFMKRGGDSWRGQERR